MRRLWFWLRKRYFLVFSAALLGALLALIIDKFFIKQDSIMSHSYPVNQSSTQIQAFPHIQDEFEQKPKLSPCVDLHNYVCSLNQTVDPTGDVRRDTIGEVEVLRIYEKLIKENRKLSSEQIDELLVQKIYTPSRILLLQRLFRKARDILLQFIDTQPFNALSRSDKMILRARLLRVYLELPPPASVYSDERDLFTRNDVYYERTSTGATRIRIGGAMLFSVKSQFNLAFTLSHELSHVIDPCELNSENIEISAYEGLAECFGASLSNFALECKPHGKISEIFADWAATHVVAEMLAEYSSSFSKSQLRSAIYSSVRDLCRDDEGADGLSSINEDIKSFPLNSKMFLSSSHPSASFRINRIFAQHPNIRRFMNCKENSGPETSGVPLYCFWQNPVNRPNQTLKSSK